MYLTYPREKEFQCYFINLYFTVLFVISARFVPQNVFKLILHSISFVFFFKAQLFSLPILSENQVLAGRMAEANS